MSHAFVAPLTDRGAVRVAGPDALKLLQGLVSNDLAPIAPGTAAHAALLSPQGKILFDFLAVRTADGFVLDVARDKAGDLVKRLGLYKLRADVAISDASADYVTLALWGEAIASSGETAATLSFVDPRHPALGRRILAEARFATDIAAASNGRDAPVHAYHARRIALGVPEGGKDYAFGDAYPHEANFDRFNGVSFSKGCYVGQEIVARMQHKTVVRKRVARVTGSAALTPGTPILLGETEIGRIGSVDGMAALALVRLDRAAEAAQNGAALHAGNATVTVHADDLALVTSQARSAGD